MSSYTAGRLLSAFVLLTAIACSAAQAQERGADMRKCIVEMPLKRTIEPTLGTPVARAPVKNLLPEPVVRVAENGSLKVKPGDVKWHADFRTACFAAKHSGKPVLMFVMLGNLDDKFC